MSASASLALLCVVDPEGIEWQLCAVIGEARGELGLTAPPEDVLRTGCKLIDIKVVID